LPAASPPQPRPPTTPRWACGRAWPRRRLTGVGRARAAGPAKGPIAMLLIFVWCFVLNTGLSCKDPYLVFLAVRSSAL
jgi:hypothetical protein